MGRVSTTGDELTAAEEATVAAIEDGTFFVVGETPTGTIDGANTSFTIASAPAPATSLVVILNGMVMTLTEDYTLSGTTLSMVVAPLTNSILRASYHVNPA